MDTVPVHSGWQTDPFEPVEQGDRVYGLGACDMGWGARKEPFLEGFAVNKEEPLVQAVVLYNLQLKLLPN